MSFLSLKRQLASVIEWPNQEPAVLLHKFPSVNDEIKNASKLIVGPGQGVILVYEGRVVEVMTTEGLYTLETANHPFITTLLKLRTAFESEHKLKIYYFRTAENTAQNWGTAAPIKYVDPVYKIPVELGANGNFSFRIADAQLFFGTKAGFSDSYTAAQARTLMQSRITQIMATQLAAAQFSYQQIDAQLGALAEGMKAVLAVEFVSAGLLLTDFRINGTVFDKDTHARIDGIANVTAESQAAAMGGMSYLEMEKLKALRDAARNQGGISSAGLQIGAGLAISKLFAEQNGQQSAADPMIRLQKLKQLLDEAIITREEFETKKKEWLDKL